MKICFLFLVVVFSVSVNAQNRLFQYHYSHYASFLDSAGTYSVKTLDSNFFRITKAYYYEGVARMIEYNEQTLEKTYCTQFYTGIGALESMRMIEYENKSNRLVFDRWIIFDYEEIKLDTLIFSVDPNYRTEIPDSSSFTLFRTKYKESKKYNDFDRIKSLDYDEAVAYAFNQDEKRHSESVLNENLKELQQKIMTKSQVDSLFTIVSDSSTYGYSTAACFIPRMGIVFYKNKKRVGYMDICLECNYLHSDPYIPSTIYYFEPMSCFCGGFSPKGQARLKRLCLELGLGECKTQSDWETEIDED